MTASPRMPPRVELPCAVPKPKCSITRRVHCPSKFVVFITTTPRLRQNQVAEIMQRCQNAEITGRRGRGIGRSDGGPAFRNAASDRARE